MNTRLSNERRFRSHARATLLTSTSRGVQREHQPITSLPRTLT